MTDHLRQCCKQTLEEMTQRSLRCLGFASKVVTGVLESYDGINHVAHKCVLPASLPSRELLDVEKYELIEQDLTFFGIVGIKDPARPEVLHSIQQCKQAGIRVFMITGDSRATAEAIARDVGILRPGDESRWSFDGKLVRTSSG